MIPETLEAMIADFGRFVESVVSENDPAGAVSWAEGLVRDGGAGQVMCELVEAKADIERLLMLGLLFRVGRSGFHEPLSEIRFGPVKLDGARVTDPERVCDLLEELREETRVETPDIPLDPRAVRDHLRARNQAIEDNPDEVIEVDAPGVDGEVTRKRVRPERDGAFLAAIKGVPGEEVEPAVGRQGGRGHPTDASENVLAVLVGGHLFAVSGARRATLVGRVCATLFGLESPSAPGGDAAISFKRRVERCWGTEAYARRARRLAESVGLLAEFEGLEGPP